MLVLVAWIIPARAGVTNIGFLGDGFVRSAAWGIVVFLILNTVANLSAPHPVERWVGSVTFVVAILTGIIGFLAPG